MPYRFQQEEKPPFQIGHLNLGGENGTERLEVSNRYLLKNGECWIPIMGEFHYSRYSEADWKTELLKMKAGGVTVVSTYVLWIYHEETEGNWNFAGNRDLRHFVRTVKECGLRMALRIGPWCHGEVRNGGFPDWLLKKGCPLRTDDPEYLGYVRRFYEKIHGQVKDFLFDTAGPIFCIQLENELVDNGAHLLTLKKLAVEVGLCAPIYTVTGWNAKYGAEIPESEVLPVFGGYPEAPWEPHTRRLEPSVHYFFQPTRNDSAIGRDLLVEKDEDSSCFHMHYDWYPFATCELGGGIQVTHHRRPVISGGDIAALALVKLGCGNNLPGYYMYHGGTNEIGEHSTLQESRATGYPNDLPVKSYDFQAPIGEYGQIRPQYRKLKCQHLFLAHFGERFGQMDLFFQKPPVGDIGDTASLRYSMRTDGRGGFVFVNNYQRLCEMPKFREVRFEVPVENGTLVFPERGMTVLPGAFFFVPWNFPMDQKLLRYATVQPLARSGRTWFFFAPDGVKAEYVFEDQFYEVKQPGMDSILKLEGEADGGIQIVTLTQEEAEHFYELDGQFYLSEGDLYLEEDGLVVYREGEADLTCWRWTKDGFMPLRWEAQSAVISLRAKPGRLWKDIGSPEDRGGGCSPASSENEFFPEFCEKGQVLSPCRNACEERDLAGPGMRRVWELEAQWEENSELVDIFLEIDYIGDLAQIYVDGILAADDFNKGVPWTVSLKALMRYGKKIELLICEKKGQQVYMEGRNEEGLALLDVEGVPVYRHKLLFTDWGK